MGPKIQELYGSFFLLPGSAYNSQTDTAGEECGEREVRGGLEGEVAGRKRGGENILYNRGGQLVPRDRVIPNSAAQA